VAPHLPLFPLQPRAARNFPLACLISLLIIAGSGRLAVAATPPTGENAYCGKGDVPQFGGKDGPAEPPKTCYYTGIDGTPSPGKQIRVSPTANLGAIVGQAKCGDTLLLPAGASFEVKELPRKNCDEQHYITIRTDTPDSKLPAEGTRITPAWAGVASLPGRPQYAQPAGGAAKLMATLLVTRPPGAVVGDHVRFIGIEWTSDPAMNIARLVSGDGADHVILDRNWIHPGQGAEVGKGIVISHGARFIAVINSYINGLNCVARSGKCTDSSAISGGNGDLPVGTFKVVNNFLEASGENILFGGAPATVNPTDIEIRRNHLFKPLAWKIGEPGYSAAPSGDPYIVKNHFELKNAQRVLFEGNLLEGSWGGFTQNGFSLAVNPKNQGNRCPKCQVTDITIRYSRIRNVAGVLVIANVRSDAGGSTIDGGRYSIHDLVADNVHDRDYAGPGVFLVMLVADPPLHDVQMDHITAFVPGPLMSLLAKNTKIDNFGLTNSVFAIGGRRPALASAGGGPDNCATKTQGKGAEAVLAECFSNYKFDHNLVITDSGHWPSGTIVASAGSAGIRDLKDGVAKDPRLCREKMAGCPKVSAGAGAAPGGRDLGADMDAVDAALDGVE
jgi:hypothetical protein